MQALAYYLALPFIYLVAWLPLPAVYAISNVLYFVLYRLIGYRKQVVIQNLTNAFPEKSNAEILQLADKFYRYLCDLMLESFKTLTFTQKQALEVFEYTPESFELINSYAQKGQSLIFVVGHHGNWEWSGNPLGIMFKGNMQVIYHELTNSYFNALMYRMRTRFGCSLIEMRDVTRTMLKNKGKVTATGFIADQTPSPENAHWMWFLNQPTPVFRGTEVIARKFNYPVIYFTTKRIKRGKYICEAKLLCAEPKLTQEGEITELHTQMLEADIIREPEIWLWSHKRWKHKPSPEVVQRLNNHKRR